MQVEQQFTDQHGPNERASYNRRSHRWRATRRPQSPEPCEPEKSPSSLGPLDHAPIGLGTRAAINAGVAGGGTGGDRTRGGVSKPAVDHEPDRLPPASCRCSVYSADGVLLGEFGEERRSFVPIAQIPKVMKDAVLAIEDARFYDHGGIDYIGMLRAGLAQFSEARSQGASTITMQVARNFYLSSEKTFTRKIYEVLLTWKIESQLTKDQILEAYMNQIYLGQRAHGFAAASEIYFGKPLKDVTSPRQRCWPACRRRRRPTTRSSTRSGPRCASSTSSSACRANGFITPSRQPLRAHEKLALPHPVRRCSARRVCRRNGTPACLCPVWRGDVQPWPHRDAHRECSRADWLPTAHCAGA